MATLQNQLRVPICGIFGHVDSGKTSFLSKLKSLETVEAGGITQGISSIFISIDKMKSLCDQVQDLAQIFSKDKSDQTDKDNFEIKINGVLFIDTPGHEAFQNFREKASDICDLAIVIIDIEKGVESQTLSSIQMLKIKKIPFIIVLTKLDKVVDWINTDTFSLKKALKEQPISAINTLNVHMEDIKYDLGKHDINAEFYFKNKTPSKTYSIIPVSNMSGEGFNDMINFIIYIVQNFMEKKLVLDPTPKIFVIDKVFDKHLGWTIHVILSNGSIKVGDKLLIQSTGSHAKPISSVIRSIIGLGFDPTKKKYIRSYLPNVSASDSVVIFAPDLENAITGDFAYQYNSDEEYKQLMTQFEGKEIKESLISKINTGKLGYYLFTSTEDEFDAGYQVFKSNDIVISNGSYGPLNEKAIDMFEIYFK
jgi:translation initiation factor 5B